MTIFVVIIYDNCVDRKILWKEIYWPIKKIIDYFEFFDFATITKSGSPEPPPIPSPTYQEIAELLDFFDVAEIEKFIEKLSEDTDSFSFSDDVIISKE